jgi:hypothetical protein
MSYEDLCAAFIFPTGAEISQLLRDIGDISDNDIYGTLMLHCNINVALIIHKLITL